MIQSEEMVFAGMRVVEQDEVFRGSCSCPTTAIDYCAREYLVHYDADREMNDVDGYGTKAEFVEHVASELMDATIDLMNESLP